MCLWRPPCSPAETCCPGNFCQPRLGGCSFGRDLVGGLASTSGYVRPALTGRTPPTSLPLLPLRHVGLHLGLRLPLRAALLPVQDQNERAAADLLLFRVRKSMGGPGGGGGGGGWAGGGRADGGGQDVGPEGWGEQGRTAAKLANLLPLRVGRAGPHGRAES